MAGEKARLIGPATDIELTASGTVTAGDVIQFGESTFEFFGIAKDTVATGEKVACSIMGAFKVPKDGNSFTQGNQVFYNASNDNFQEGSSGGVLAGVVSKAALAGDSYGEVILIPTFLAT